LSDSNDDANEHVNHNANQKNGGKKYYGPGEERQGIYMKHCLKVPQERQGIYMKHCLKIPVEN
jgi:hypothetical protein